METEGEPVCWPEGGRGLKRDGSQGGLALGSAKGFSSGKGGGLCQDSWR